MMLWLCHGRGRWGERFAVAGPGDGSTSTSTGKIWNSHGNPMFLSVYFGISWESKEDIHISPYKDGPRLRGKLAVRAIAGLGSIAQFSPWRTLQTYLWHIYDIFCWYLIEMTFCFQSWSDILLTSPCSWCENSGATHAVWVGITSCNMLQKSHGRSTPSQLLL
jgi:hypothetical protein